MGRKSAWGLGRKAAPAVAIVVALLLLPAAAAAAPGGTLYVPSRPRGEAS